jgi:hypothetical protein
MRALSARGWTHRCNPQSLVSLAGAYDVPRSRAGVQALVTVRCKDQKHDTGRPRQRRSRVRDLGLVSSVPTSAVSSLRTLGQDLFTGAVVPITRSRGTPQRAALLVTRPLPSCIGSRRRSRMRYLNEDPHRAGLPDTPLRRPRLTCCVPTARSRCETTAVQLRSGRLRLVRDRGRPGRRRSRAGTGSGPGPEPQVEDG